MIGWRLSSCAAAGVLLLALSSGNIALAQKSGGTLKIQHWDSPASMSIHEEAIYSAVVLAMGVMNNFVIFD
jgi:peptide/nickel transport system substrate-binding protein